MRRRSIHVDGLGHGAQPIPLASRIGDLVWSGGISGQNPATGVIPDDLHTEVAQMFLNAATTVTAAGGTTDDIIRVTVQTEDRVAAGAAINAAWTLLFPDPDDRPARQTVERPLPGTMNVQCELVAVIGPNAA